jgi:hypothetical protein
MNRQARIVVIFQIYGAAEPRKSIGLNSLRTDALSESRLCYTIKTGFSGGFQIVEAREARSRLA